ncbi:MAG: M48 family metallopeptidase [Planctomycetes bacterium]|nr:M48 family metallopeptidase [Planctomycetota bacterium]
MRKNPSLAGRAVLAVVLMLGFYLLALGICVTLALLLWADVQAGRVHPKLWIVAAVTIGVVAWSVWPRAAKFPDPGIRLREDEQPALWKLVRQVAQAAGQEPPRELFLVGDVNAFVAERDSRMGFGGTRILGIGLPLLQVLSVPQLKSVLAHEFGHFHGGDTRLGPFVYRTRDAIGRTVVNFQKAGSLMGKPFEWYGRLFLRATFAISRAQEFAADALAVRLVGREPVQTSLRLTSEVAPLFDHYVRGEYLPVLNRNVRPPLAGGFALFLASRAIRELQVQVREEAMQAKGNPYDSHPPLAERLAAAAAVERPGSEPASGPPAIGLLRNLDALEAKLLAFQTGAEEVARLPAGPWHEVAVPALLAGWSAFVDQHGRKLPALRVADLAAQKGRLAELAAAVDPQVPEEERRGFGAWVLGVLLGVALHRAGWAVETGPGDPAYVVRGEVRLEPMAIGRSLAGGTLTEEGWAAECARHGIGDLVLAGPDLPSG